MVDIYIEVVKPTPEQQIIGGGKIGNVISLGNKLATETNGGRLHN